MCSIITLAGIDEAIDNLHYNERVLKYKLIHSIREYYEGERSIDSIVEVASDELIKKLWDTEDDPIKIKNKRRNLSSIKSSINADLRRLHKQGRNSEGISISPNNVFVMSDEAKTKILESFTYDSKGESPIPLTQIMDVLKTVNDILQKPDDMEDSDEEGFKKLDQLKEIIQDLSQKVGLRETGEVVKGTESGSDAKGTDAASTIAHAIDGSQGVIPEPILGEPRQGSTEGEAEIGTGGKEASQGTKIKGDQEEIGPGDGLDGLELDEDLEEIMETPEEPEDEVVEDEIFEPELEEVDSEEDIEGDGLEELEIEEEPEIEDDLDEVNDDIEEDLEEIDFEEEPEKEDVESEDVPEEMIVDEDDDVEDDELEEGIEDVDLEEEVEAIDPESEIEDEEVVEDATEEEDLDEVADEIITDLEPENEELDDIIEADLEEGAIELVDEEVVEDVEREDIEDVDGEEDLEEVDIGDELVSEEEIEDLDIDDKAEDMEIDADLEEVDLDEEPEADEELVDVDEDEELEELEDIESKDDAENVDYDEGLDPTTHTLDDILQEYSDEGFLGEEGAQKAKVLADEFNDSLAAMDKYYNQYLFIPKGKYKVGNKFPKKSERPEKKISLESFYFGKFPVTNALFEVFVEKTSYKTTAERVGYGTVYYGRYQKTISEDTGMETFNWNSALNSDFVKGAYWYQPLGPGSTLHQKRNHPVVQVSHEDAMAFAAWTGKRLPTEDEWGAASRMANGYMPSPKRCNIEDSYIGDTTPVDEYKDHANEFGIIDIIGNVLEWTINPNAKPSKPKDNQKAYYLKGGSWISGGNVCVSSRILSGNETYSNIIGFRCVAY